MAARIIHGLSRMARDPDILWTIRETRQLISVIAIVLAGSCTGGDSVLRLSVTPVKPSFVAEEPMGCWMEITNTSGRDLCLDLRGIESHLKFRCNGEGARRIEPPADARAKRGIIVIRRFYMNTGYKLFPAKASYRVIVFPNHELEFQAGKEYLVSCVAQIPGHFEGESEDRKKPGGVYQEVTQRCESEFVIKVDAGELEPEHWRWLVEKWNRQCYDDCKTVIGGLSCLKDRSVIPHLVRFGRDEPSLSYPVAQALRRFASLPEGLQGLESLAVEFPEERALNVREEWRNTGDRVLQDVFSVFEQLDKCPSQEFLHAQLTSRNGARKWRALRFLLDKPVEKVTIPVQDVEALCQDMDDELSKLARRVLGIKVPEDPEKPAVPDNPGQF